MKTLLLFLLLIPSICFGELPPNYAPNYIQGHSGIARWYPPQQGEVLNWLSDQDNPSIVPAYADDYGATFSRASGATVSDHEAVLTKNITDEARFTGSRRVENLLSYSEDFSNAAWTKSGTATVTGTNVLNFPAVNDNVNQRMLGISNPDVIGRTYTASIDLSGNGTVSILIFDWTTFTGDFKSVTLTATPQRFSLSRTVASGADDVYFIVKRNVSDTATQVTATNAQLENVTGQSVTTPGDYVSADILSDPWHGAGADGAELFNYKNATIVDVNGVVTEARGAAIAAATLKGFHQGPQRTNKIEAYNLIGADQDGSELITNGGFDSDTDWTKGTGWTISSGLANFNTSSTTNINQLIASVTGTIIEVSFTVTISSGGIRARNSGGWVGTTYSSSGTYTERFLQSGSANFILETSGASVGSVDNVTVKEIGGTDINTGAFVSGLGEDAQATAADNPIPGMTVSGDAAAVLSIVDDSAELAAAGLDRLNPSGKVYKLDNSAGVASAFVIIDGFTGNTNNHLSSAWVRETAGNVGVGITGESIVSASSANYERIDFSGVPADGTKRLYWSANATGVGYFILPQLEEGNTISSEIIVQGAATTRAADDLQLPVADGVNFRQAQGQLFFKFTSDFNAADISANMGLVTFNDSTTNGVYYDGTDLIVSDGTNTATIALAVVSGTEYSVGLRWGNSTMQLTVDGSSGTAGTYDGAFTLGTHYRIGYGATEGFHIKNIRVLTVDKGEAYAEDQTTDMFNFDIYQLFVDSYSDDYKFAEAI